MEVDHTLRRLVVAFLERVDIQPSGCWFWSGSVDGDGSPIFSVSVGQTEFRGSVRRFLFYGHKRVENRNTKIVTSCQDPRCVCPHHLVEARIGNRRGMKQSYTHSPSGSRRYASEISPEQRVEIIDKLQRGITQSTVAAGYGVHQSAISRIWRRHVEQRIGKP